MITLYNFGPAFGLPDPSPFVMKVETLLKMAKLPYRTDATGFAKAPKGKIPSSATSRFSWAANRPASTPPCSRLPAPCCVRISNHVSAAPLNGAKACAVTWGA
jgi:hypothetical protein